LEVRSKFSPRRVDLPPPRSSLHKAGKDQHDSYSKKGPQNRSCKRDHHYPRVRMRRALVFSLWTDAEHLAAWWGFSVAVDLKPEA